jgi:hypothetical protein
VVVDVMLMVVVTAMTIVVVMVVVVEVDTGMIDTADVHGLILPPDAAAPILDPDHPDNDK